VPVVDADPAVFLQQDRHIRTLEAILMFGDQRLFDAARYAVKERRWSLPDDDARSDNHLAAREMPRLPIRCRRATCRPRRVA
jgi:hypothetical protein